MVDRTLSEQADRLTRRRARMLLLLGIIYLGQQAAYFADAHNGPERTVNHVKIGAWVVFSLLMLLILTTKAFWLQSRAVRDMVDDETTRAHRSDAQGWGFIMAILTAITLYFVALFEPMGAREAVHIIVSFGLASALVRFGWLERRAMRGE